MISFDILNRFSGAVQFTAEIDCDESTRRSIKIGLAVKWAIKTGANLRDADLRDAYLGGAYLGDADLRDANLGDANLGDADLRDANLGDANLGGANLGGAYLRGANLGGANLGGAYLGSAYLGGAYLGDADLRDAYLGGAYLGGAYLGDANLGGANLGGGVKIKSLLASAFRFNDQYQFFLWETECGHVITAGCRQMTIADYRAHIAKDYPNTAKGDETSDILDYFEARLARAGKAVAV